MGRFETREKFITIAAEIFNLPPIKNDGGSNIGYLCRLAGMSEERITDVDTSNPGYRDLRNVIEILSEDSTLALHIGNDRNHPDRPDNFVFQREGKPVSPNVNSDERVKQTIGAFYEVFSVSDSKNPITLLQKVRIGKDDMILFGVLGEDSRVSYIVVSVSQERNDRHLRGNIECFTVEPRQN